MIKKNIKKKILILTIIVGLLSICFPSFKNTYSISNSTNYGITVGSDGTMYLNNTYFKAMGLNAFDFVSRGVTDEYFATLAQYKIPFIRVTFGGWWPHLYEMYDMSSNHAEYFELADELVKKAEEHNIGIVMDFFWNIESFVYHNGEQKADMGNSNSKSIKYAKSFVKTLINRYKNSPAIWGYEIGNEYNLGADLYSSTSNLTFSITADGLGTQAKDYYTTNELVVFTKAISEAINEADPNRFITTGDAVARDAAYGLYSQTVNIGFNNHGPWQNNFDWGGADNYNNMVSKLHPNPIDTLSFHIYPSQFTDGTLGKLGNLSDYIRVYSNVAKSTGKAMYFGEFGGSNINISTFDGEMSDISNSTLQLSSVWLAGEDGVIFNPENKDVESYVLQKVQQYNSPYQNVINTAWDSWKKSISVNINNGSYTLTKTNNYSSNETSSYYLYGDKVKINVTPNAFYGVKGISVKTASGTDIAVTNNEFTVPNEDIIINVSIEQTSPFTYTIQYNGNGGDNVPGNQTKTQGVDLTLSNSIPTKENHIFLGWGTVAGSTNVVYNAGSKYTNDSDITLYAIWQEKAPEAPSTYTVTYDANGGYGAPSAQTKTQGEYLTLSTQVPDRDNYFFLGWGTSPTSKEVVYDAGAFYAYDANITLYAIWQPLIMEYTIQYNANGGYDAPGPQTKFENTDIYLSTIIPKRDNYAFLGWGYDANSKDIIYNVGSIYTDNADITLYAIWQEIIPEAPTTYVINYYSNGGTNAPSSQTKTHGINITLSSNVPTRANYTFLGWGLSKDATTVSYSAGSTYSVDANVSLYAIWKENAPDIKTTYTITYDANGGVGAPSAQTKTHGVDISLSKTNPTRHNYIFLGWGTSRTTASIAFKAGATYKENSNITLYAIWKSNPPVVTTTYTVKYDANGGTNAPNNQTGSSITIANQIPTKLGYTFLNWNTDQYGTGIEYSSGDSYLENYDATLYAIWKPNTYNIEYNLNGGTIYAVPNSATYDETITIANPSKTIRIIGNGNKTGAKISEPVTSTQIFAGWISSDIDTSTALYNDHAWNDKSMKVLDKTFKNLSSKNNATVNLVANWTAVDVTLPTVTKEGSECTWNTLENGSGISYQSGSNFTPEANSESSINLYAICKNKAQLEEEQKNPNPQPEEKQFNLKPIHIVILIGLLDLGYLIYYFTKRN